MDGWMEGGKTCLSNCLETDIGVRPALSSQGAYNAYYEAKLVVSPKKIVFYETENNEELR